jgi:hypothetical protein
MRSTLDGRHIAFNPLSAKANRSTYDNLESVPNLTTVTPLNPEKHPFAMVSTLDGMHIGDEEVDDRALHSVKTYSPSQDSLESASNTTVSSF